MSTLQTPFLAAEGLRRGCPTAPVNRWLADRLGLWGHIGLLMAGLLAQPQPARGGGTVGTCTEAALRAALVGGGHVTLACEGTIVLSAPLLVTHPTALDGTGHAVVLSGNKAVRVLEVAPGATLALTNLTLADGFTNRGAGLLSQGAEVICDRCVFCGNEARGTNGLDNASGEPAAGGAIWSAGPLTLLNCGFETNSATGGNGNGGNYGGGEARGGAIHAEGTLVLSNVAFFANGCGGGRSGRGETGWGPNGADAFGGAVYCAGDLEAWDCTFRGNSTSGGWPGGWRPHRGDGRGGALALAGGTATVCRGLFESNSVSGCAGLGGGIWHGGQSLVVSNVTFRGNNASGDTLSYYYDAEGGPGAGGGLCSQARCTVLDCVFEQNRSTGGRGNALPFGWGLPCGPGLGGGVFSAAGLQLERCTLVNNVAHGGDQDGVFAAGGPAFGGAVLVAGNEAGLVNLTVCSNTASGGAPDRWIGSQAGPASGGGLCATNGVVGLTNCTFWGDTATGIPYPDFTGTPGEERGGGLANLTPNALAVHNSIIAGSPSGGDVFGPLAGDHNLIAADPRLQALADNGGLTPTLALCWDSPAINAAAAATAPATDQRGLPRPFGPAPDLGAFERSGPDITEFCIRSLHFTNGQWRLDVEGLPGLACRLQASADLLHWLDLGTNPAGGNGWFWMNDPASPPPAIRFYRIVSP